MSKQEENPRQKLENQLVSMVQKTLGEPLNKDQLEQVHFLAYDLAHLGDARYTEVKPLDKDLESLLTVTGLKASQITSITELVASYHPTGSAHDDVNSAIGKFEEVHKVELAGAKKANDFLGAVIKDLGGSSRLDDFQMGA